MLFYKYIVIMLHQWKLDTNRSRNLCSQSVPELDLSTSTVESGEGGDGA